MKVKTAQVHALLEWKFEFICGKQHYTPKRSENTYIKHDKGCLCFSPQHLALAQTMQPQIHGAGFDLLTAKTHQQSHRLRLISCVQPSHHSAQPAPPMWRNRPGAHN